MPKGEMRERLVGQELEIHADFGSVEKTHLVRGV
jgi:hypothetical protein